MSRPVPPRRWVIDGLEEDAARIEEDGGRMITVPRWLLPAEAKEGQVLQVARVAGKGSATVTITVDQPATAEGTSRSAAQVEKVAKASKKRDAGGDVTL